MASSDLWKWCLSIKQSSSRFKNTWQFSLLLAIVVVVVVVVVVVDVYRQQDISSSFCVKTLHCSSQQVGLLVLLPIVTDSG